jgi:UDP-glucose 4-epimerase
MKDKSTKVIVTGGAGFIGSHIVSGLIKEGYNVHVIDNLSTGRKEKINSKAVFYKKDIRDLKSILPIFKGAKYVFHLAALPRIQLSIDDPKTTHETNVNGTLNVLIASKESKVEKVIYSASSSAYGNQKKLPLKENFPACPLSPYGLQKYIGEEYCRIFTEIYGLKTVSLRYFNVYGPGMSDKGSYLAVFAVFLNQVKNKKPMTILGDGEQTRSFTHVRDVVRANILAAKSNKTGSAEVINICSSKFYSVNEITKMIGGKVNYLPKRIGEIKKSFGDNSLAKKILEWKPEEDFKKGIDELKEIYLN